MWSVTEVSCVVPRTDWRTEMLELGRKPDTKQGKRGCAEDLGQTCGFGEEGSAKVSDGVTKIQQD